MLKTVKNKPLLAHQRLAIEQFLDQDFGALFLPMGACKTRIALSLLALKNVERAIIITKKTILYTIAEEIELWTNYSCQVINASNKHKTFHAHILIVNYDILASLIERLIDYNAQAIIADESSLIKNRTAFRTRAIFHIANGTKEILKGSKKVIVRAGDRIRFRFILTGTSITRGFEDWFMQYRFLNESIMPKYITAYRRMYCPTQMAVTRSGKRFPKLLGYQNITSSDHPGIPALMDRVKPFTFSMRKEDCLDLPPKTYHVERLELTKEQKEMYKIMKRDSIVGDVVAKVLIAKINKLHQIANGFLIGEERNTKRIPGLYPKIEWLKEWLPEMTKDHKIVIWTNFIETGKMVRELLGRLNIKYAYTTKEMSDEERKRQNDLFQKDKTIRIFSCPIKVGGYGIQLFDGDYAVFVDNDYNYADRMQAEDRIHRMGQVRNCHYIDLIAEKTVEEGIMKNLKGKKHIHDLSVDELRLIIKED